MRTAEREKRRALAQRRRDAEFPLVLGMGEILREIMAVGLVDYLLMKAARTRFGKVARMVPMPLLWEVTTAMRSSSGSMRMN